MIIFHRKSQLLVIFSILIGYTFANIEDASVEEQPASGSAEDQIIASDGPVISEAVQDDVVINYSTPNLDADNLQYFLYESFDDELAFNNRWTQSKATKAESQEFKYDGEWALAPAHSSIKGN